MELSWNEIGLRVELDSGPREISWSDITLVIAETNDRGPFEDDLFYVFFSRQAVPLPIANALIAGSDLLSEIESKLPGFDFEKAIEAASSTENRVFLLWEEQESPLRQGHDFAWMRNTVTELFGTGAETLAEDVIKRYEEPHRRYHSVAHLRECLIHWERIKDLLKRPREVAIALIYHDVVYDPLSKLNEENSAQLFRAQATALQISDPPAVEKMILATKHHPAMPSGTDLDFLIDVDLSILGSHPVAFEEYERGIRYEYRNVLSPIFHFLRAKFLRSLLKRQTLFLTPYFQERFEERARRNIAKLLEEDSYRWTTKLIR